MRKSVILIVSSMILLSWVTSSYAGEILGYPLVEKQAKFYTIILGVIAASVLMVSAIYLCFWLVDSKKKVAIPALERERERGILGDDLAVAFHSAK
jgi:hypothetical protein